MIERGRERLKRTLNEVVEQDLLVNNISKNLVTYKAQLCRKIHVADPT